ncbi:MAG: excinuclease ABC subunit UvrC [Treponema sp.]|nr:excinuclease ABC subunit UvrC [Treponema sp.]
MENQLNSENPAKESAFDAPSEPGVYLMKNEDSQIIYIGKAKSLKNRLKSYFSGEKDIKTATLLKYVHSIETIIVASEYDALLLENTLIKQHSPKYNISLKDGKTYPVIRITHEEFPRVFRTRRIIQDKSIYYGPYADAHAVNTIMELIDKIFPLRKCKKIKKNVPMGSLPRAPCMYYHIGRCMAPCCGKINMEDYAVHVQHVQKLLSGEKSSLIIELTAKMHEEARALQFEKAAFIRNTINAIENLQSGFVEDLNPENRDYIAWACEGVFISITVFSMRGGKMTGRDLFRTRCAANEQETLEQFITSYYDNNRHPPLKIFFQDFTLQSGEENKQLLKNWFKEQFGYTPEILSAKDKHHKAILSMAHLNAQEDLRKRMKERGAGPALDEITRIFNLQTRPERIEGFDISHLGGRHPVASLVSFKNGTADRKNYRHFKLRTVIGITDDYAAMREAVRRRYSRLIREGATLGATLPDMILVDGGLGQVNAAKGVLDELGVNIFIVGLAKRNEELWLPEAKKPVILSRQSEALKVLQNIRDECHRFASNLNTRLRSKDLFFTTLESVEGIGPKRAGAIMKEYESIADIAASKPHEMSKRCRISEEAARAVRAVAKLSLETI